MAELVDAQVLETEVTGEEKLIKSQKTSTWKM